MEESVVAIFLFGGIMIFEGFGQILRRSEKRSIAVSWRNRYESQSDYENFYRNKVLTFLGINNNNTDKDGVITLNSKQISRLEDLLRAYITDVKVLKYDKDIDISKIVSKTHIMISDETENIYLVSYIVKEAYPVDNDIARAMNYKNTAE